MRVINEDRVAPGQGFATHGHKDMEIISYVLEGGIEHKDSMGNGSVIRPGDVQRMTAGTGVLHSEFNPSPSDAVHFLQVWLLPGSIGLPPGYEQKHFPAEEKRGRLCLIASPDGAQDSVTVHQDARSMPACSTTARGNGCRSDGAAALMCTSRAAGPRSPAANFETGDALKIADEDRVNIARGNQAEGSSSTWRNICKADGRTAGSFLSSIERRKQCAPTILWSSDGMATRQREHARLRRIERGWQPNDRPCVREECLPLRVRSHRAVSLQRSRERRLLDRTPGPQAQ